MSKISLISLLLITAVTAQFYEDHRCVCECPSPAEMINTSLSRVPTIIIADVPPHECDCLGVVLPRLSPSLKDLEYEYCLLCNCAYQVRNTSVIKVVVIALVWLMALLLIYLTFLICLNPILIGRRQGYNNMRDRNFEEGRSLIVHTEEEHEHM